ncbi:MAG: PucR family transcriptional regulator, partial [Ruminococcus sp.]|nr:PucR family transcriptional regulator [Ruminococcus sp.]
MSNRLFQGIIGQLKDTMNCTVGVADQSALIIACSDQSKIGTINEYMTIDLSDSFEVFLRDGYACKPFGSHGKPEYVVFVEGTDDAAVKFANVLAVTMSSIKTYYDEKYDRTNFIKNIVLDNV